MPPHRTLALVVAALIACGGDGPSSPEGPEPPEDDGAAEPDLSTRVLPEGTYDVLYAACQECEAGAVPDYLLMFAGGVSGTVTITDAEEWHASLRLLEMRAGEEPATSILDLFGASAVALQWNTETGRFEGRVPYGAAAEFIPAFRSSNGDLRCGLDLFHAKHDVGETVCSVTARS